MMVAASFTGCIDSEDSNDLLTEPVGEVNVPGNALVFTRDADATECSNGGITLDIGVDEDGDGKLNSTETFNTSTICNGADGINGKDGSSCSAFDSGNGTYTVSCEDGTSFTVSDGQQGPVGEKGEAGEDVTRSNSTLLTRIDDPDASLNCVAGGRVISYGLDNGDGDGISANGNLESGEIDTSTTLCSTMSFGLFRDINLGSGSSLPTEFTALNDDQIIFTADNGELGRELWLLRPDAGSVVMLKDINLGTGGSDPRYFTEFNGELYFSADDGEHGTELWKTNGTKEGTILVADINEDYDSYPRYFTEMNGELYFSADDGEHGTELWKTNGTEEGTIMVKDIWNGSNGGGPRGFTLMNGELFFSATDSYNIHGNELWKTDGTEEGTTMVKDIRDGSDSSSPNEFTELNGELYFKACDAAHSCELWKTDGTSIGTILVADIDEDYGSYPTYLIEFNGELYFRASDAVTGTELWKTDGTGAVLVKDINEGEDSSSISHLIKMNGELYFAADDGVHGREVWKTNGTEEGTSMVVDLNYGSAMSTYLAQAVVHTDIYGNEKIYFIADSGSFGYELHVTDGTERGTVMVKDFSYGSSDGVKDYHCDYNVDFCAPLTILSFGKYLLFSANDGYFGIELYYNNVVETSVFYS